MGLFIFLVIKRDLNSICGLYNPNITEKTPGHLEPIQSLKKAENSSPTFH
jgi:hypothetical protein